MLDTNKGLQGLVRRGIVGRYVSITQQRRVMSGQSLRGAVGSAENKAGKGLMTRADGSAVGCVFQRMLQQYL